MKKIAINKCFGGFGLSHKALMLYADLCGFKLFTFQEKRDSSGSLVTPLENIPWDGTGKEPYHINYLKLNDWSRRNEPGVYFSVYDIQRDDPNLIKVIEQLGEEASDRYARIQVVEIPDEVAWEIHDYDGQETIREQHRSWY